MIAQYNRKSFYWGVPGIILQFGGLFVDALQGFGLLGTILLLVGLGYYAKAKGRNWAWGLFAFLPIIGIIVLLCLKDESLTTEKIDVLSAQRTYRFWLILFLVTLGPLVMFFVIRGVFGPLYSAPPSSDSLATPPPLPPFPIFAAIFFSFAFIFPAVLILHRLKTRAKRAETEQAESGKKLQGPLREEEKPVSAKESTTNNDVGRLEKCANCQSVIGKLEQPWVFNNRIVCAECWKQLKTSSNNSTA